MSKRSLMAAIALAAATGEPAGEARPMLSIGGVTRPPVTLPRTRGSANQKAAKKRKRNKRNPQFTHR